MFKVLKYRENIFNSKIISLRRTEFKNKFNKVRQGNDKGY